MRIKEWKVREIASSMKGGFLVEIDGVERETEKSYLLNITWGILQTLKRS